MKNGYLANGLQGSSGLKVAFGDQLIRVPGGTAANAGYDTSRRGIESARHSSGPLHSSLVNARLTDHSVLICPHKLLFHAASPPATCATFPPRSVPSASVNGRHQPVVHRRALTLALLSHGHGGRGRPQFMHR